MQLVWPTSLCELIAVETNRYAQQNNRPKWVDVSTDEVWIFLGIVVLMGIYWLPQIKDYWSMDRLLGVPAVQQSISLRRFLGTVVQPSLTYWWLSLYDSAPIR